MFACFLARFLASLSIRRSRSLLSRESFDNVVFRLPREAMRVSILLWVPSSSVMGKPRTREPVRRQRREGARLRPPVPVNRPT